MLPFPDAGRPIARFEFVHLISAPGTLLARGMFTSSPGQKSASTIAVTTGSGLMMILNDTGKLEHEFFAPVTVMLPIIGEPEMFVAAVNEGMSPVLPAPRLIAG